MSYASPLEARIAKKTTRAISDHGLIDDGDHILVGLSGGKDSWALMQMLDVLRRRAPIRFTLVALTVDSGYAGFRGDVVAKECAERGWEHHIQRTNIGGVIDDILDPADTPCALCARLRRGVLYRRAGELGAIALGHHADDFIETLLLNVFFAGALKSMPARLVSDNGQHVVIRPLAYVSEDDVRSYTKACGLPIIGCCCPACGDLSLQRQRVKRLIFELEREHTGVKSSMLRALGNVAPRHLMDRRLTPRSDLAQPTEPGPVCAASLTSGNSSRGSRPKGAHHPADPGGSGSAG
jgi:tRNA 2-thiocytidine biosynthesis protein TtcA